VDTSASTTSHTPFELLECQSCGRRWSSHSTGCPYCGAMTVATLTHPATIGRLYSWTTVYRDFGTGVQVPYTSACIDLDGGGRIVARLDDIRPDQLIAGAMVTANSAPDAETGTVHFTIAAEPR
jgi:uncharacterized OB-fold protein